VALVALAVVGVPLLWNGANKPAAAIKGAVHQGAAIPIVDNGTVPSQIDLFGISKHIPVNSDVWVIVRATAEGRWYPAARLSGENWATQDIVLRMALGYQDIYLYLVSISEEQPLIDYVKTLTMSRDQGSESDDGLSTLPHGLVLQIMHLRVVS
jgi:hypothetical protein